MKRSIAVLLTILLLFSFSSCLSSNEDTTTPPTDTKTPPDTIISENNTTEPDETSNILPPETVNFVFDDSKLPTITTIKFRENDFTNLNPTDQELTNFLCEALIYNALFLHGFLSAYLIPVDTSTVYLGDHDIENYRLDPAYVKNKNFMESVCNSYYDEYNGKYEWRNYFNLYGVNNGDTTGDDIYMPIIDMSIPNGYDTSLINITSNKIDSDEIEVLAYVYFRSHWVSEENEDCFKSTIEQIQLTLKYIDGKWKISYMRNITPTDPKDRLTTLSREDYGKRITIIKPD